MQAVWTASILIAAPVSLHRQWLTIPTAHVEVLAGAAAIGSVFAELFMIKSLLVFDPKVPVENTSAPTSPRYKSSRVMHNLNIRDIDGILVECRHDPFTVCVIIKGGLSPRKAHLTSAVTAAAEAAGLDRCGGHGTAVGHHGRRDATCY